MPDPSLRSGSRNANLLPPSGRDALQLIVAENTYSSARLGYVRAVGQRLTDSAELFIAIGGGWWNDGGLPPG